MIKGKKYLKKQAVASVLALSMAAASLTGCSNGLSSSKKESSNVGTMTQGEASTTKVAEHVWVHKTAKVFASAYLAGPAIIGAETEVRQCAFVRGNALVGKGCVIGNSTELKNVIIFDNVQVPHYNYVGDSILGFKSHMGAGSITSNVKSDKTLVHVKGIDPETNEKFDLETGLKKFGAMLGNHVEVGCNSVLNPGTVIGSNSNVYPLSPVRGFVPAESITWVCCQ